MLRFHTQTGGSTLTAQQPENNVVRVTLQALAAVMGGTQSLHTNSMDEALWLPTEKSVRVALRTQQIIAHESGAADTIDPLAGSYLIEYLTDEIERRAQEYIDKIDAPGRGAESHRAGLHPGRDPGGRLPVPARASSGANRSSSGSTPSRSDEPVELERLKVDPAIEQNQVARLEEFKRQRDSARVSELLLHLETAAQGSDNLMPLFIELVEGGLTLGEICSVLRQVWGEYQPPAWL